MDLQTNFEHHLTVILSSLEGLLVGVILRFGVHVPPSMSDVVQGCAVNASPATLLVNVSGRFYEYTLKGEVSRGKGHQVQDDEMLRKVRRDRVVIEFFYSCISMFLLFL